MEFLNIETTAALLVILLRILIPLGIFRWPLLFGVIVMLLDGADVILVDGFAFLTGEPGGLGAGYHGLDKWLDMYYLSFELVVSLRWSHALARNTSIALFLYRVIGFAAFELTGVRKFLFFFPNLFENFFLFYLAARKYFPRLVPRTFWGVVGALLILYIPKFFQEYILHFLELQPWVWFKGLFL